MHLLYISQNKIKLLSYKKDLFKQIEIDYFSKTHTTNLLEENKIYNLDILASAIKEATSSVFKEKKASNDIIYILPSPPFLTIRVTLPLDIHEQAIQSFINQKMLSLYPYKDLEFFFTLHQSQDKRIAVIYALEKDTFEKLIEITKILELNFKGILPESLALYNLFKDTLSKTKKEHIWYLRAEKEEESITAEGYFYDNVGPLENKKIELKAKTMEELETLIKKTGEDAKDIKFNRLILSGNVSLDVRQDILTKKVGIWINPLPKIVERFYLEKIKKIINQDPKIFLKYDAQFAALTNPQMPLLNKSKIKYSKVSPKKQRVEFPFKKLLLPFIASLIFAFTAVIGIKSIKTINLPNFKTLVKKPTPTPTPTPTNTPTPTPTVKREEIKIKILNGSGIKGQAAKLASILKEKGYKEIVVGNADSFDYEKTEIRIKNNAVKQILLNDLKEYVENPKIEPSSEKLLEDVTLIIGKDFSLE